MIIWHDNDTSYYYDNWSELHCYVLYILFLHISAWYTLVLKEAKERHAIKEVKDAIIKGNTLEIVHLLHFAYSQHSFYIYLSVLLKCIDFV